MTLVNVLSALAIFITLTILAGGWLHTRYELAGVRSRIRRKEIMKEALMGSLLIVLSGVLFVGWLYINA